MSPPRRAARTTGHPQLRLPSVSCGHDIRPFGMRANDVDFRGLLTQEFHDFIVRRAEFPVMGGVAMAQDVMRRLF